MVVTDDVRGLWELSNTSSTCYDHHSYFTQIFYLRLPERDTFSIDWKVFQKRPTVRIYQMFVFNVYLRIHARDE